MKYFYVIFFLLIASFRVTAQTCEGVDGTLSVEYYDWATSGFHQSIVKSSNGKYYVVGEGLAQSGGNQLTLSDLSTMGITGTILHVGVGSKVSRAQALVLTTDGLWLWGNGADGSTFKTTVISPQISTNKDMHRITINGKTDGLPAGVSPLDVKSMFVTTNVAL